VLKPSWSVRVIAFCRDEKLLVKFCCNAAKGSCDTALGELELEKEGTLATAEELGGAAAGGEITVAAEGGAASGALEAFTRTAAPALAPELGAGAVTAGGAGGAAADLGWFTRDRAPVHALAWTFGIFSPGKPASHADASSAEE
jgi:hypothetical protein